MRSERRSNKIQSVVSNRQHSLHVVLENIHDPHNVSAVFRTCDAAGVPSISLIYNDDVFPKIGKKSSASAFKWISKQKYNSVSSCYNSLKEKGFTIIASSITDDSVSLFDLNLSDKTAIILGNEHRGVSEEAASKADVTYKIPMFGMVQSLNVSVAAAITLYEAVRQRLASGLYPSKELNELQLKLIIDDWLKK